MPNACGSDSAHYSQLEVQAVTAALEEEMFLSVRNIHEEAAERQRLQQLASTKLRSVGCSLEDELETSELRKRCVAAGVHEEALDVEDTRRSDIQLVLERQGTHTSTDLAHDSESIISSTRTLSELDREKNEPKEPDEHILVPPNVRAAFDRVDRNADGLTRAELIKTLRQDSELQELLQLPRRVGDSQRQAFERVFQGKF